MASFDLSHLPPAERAAAYRALAEMHLKLCRQAQAEARVGHLELAALWTRLAAQAEHQAAAEAAHAAAEPVGDPGRPSA